MKQAGQTTQSVVQYTSAAFPLTVELWDTENAFAKRDRAASSSIIVQQHLANHRKSTRKENEKVKVSEFHASKPWILYISSEQTQTVVVYDYATGETLLDMTLREITVAAARAGGSGSTGTGAHLSSSSMLARSTGDQGERDVIDADSNGFGRRISRKQHQGTLNPVA
jgi:hypothetical protein